MPIVMAKWAHCTHQLCIRCTCIDTFSRLLPIKMIQVSLTLLRGVVIAVRYVLVPKAVRERVRRLVLMSQKTNAVS